MKSMILLCTALATLAADTLLAGPADPDRPTGSLNVSTKLVESRLRAMLRWRIQYPENLENVIRIDSQNTVTPHRDVLVEMRLAGISFRPDGRDATVLLRARIGSSPWQLLFMGQNKSVEPAKPIFRKVVRAGTSIDLSARGQLHGTSSWTPARTTGQSSLNIKALTNGDAVPGYSPAFQHGDIESHIFSYVRNGRIVLNPREVIYLVEIGQNDPASGGFDMQDLVVIISFKDSPSDTPIPG